MCTDHTAKPVFLAPPLKQVALNGPNVDCGRRLLFEAEEESMPCRINELKLRSLVTERSWAAAGRVEASIKKERKTQHRKEIKAEHHLNLYHFAHLQV